MKLTLPPFKTRNLFLTVMLLKAASGAYAADQELLDILLQNGAITQAQHNELLKSESLTSEDILQSPVTVERFAEVTEEVVASEVAKQFDSQFPVTAQAQCFPLAKRSPKSLVQFSLESEKTAS